MNEEIELLKSKKFTHTSIKGGEIFKKKGRYAMEICYYADTWEWIKYTKKNKFGIHLIYIAKENKFYECSDKEYLKDLGVIRAEA